MLQATAVILAGGQSSRMRRNKAVLKISHQTIIERIVTELSQVFPEIIIVSNDQESYRDLPVKVVSDVIPGRGPLSGIHAGLIAGSYQHAFVVACDMPFVKKELARFLIEQVDGYDVCVPQIGDYLQPLHSVYSKKCINPIEHCLRNSIHKIIAFYPEVKVKFIGEEKIRSLADPDVVFFNVNTENELTLARLLAEEDANGSKTDGSYRHKKEC